MNGNSKYFIMTAVALGLAGAPFLAFALTTLNPPGGIWNSSGNVGVGTTGPGGGTQN